MSRLHTPARPARKCGCETDRVSGIPPTWGSWIVLDLERPIWAALQKCDASDEQARAKSYQLFLRVISAIRQARPRVRIALYGIPLNDEGPCVEIERRILARVDGSVPPFFKRTAQPNDGEVHEPRLRRHLAYKKSRPGFKVFPIVWKKWKNVPWPGKNRPSQMPEAVVRRQIGWLLDFEVEGTRVDGLVIFGDSLSRDQATDIEFARILVEEVAKRTPAP